MIGGGVPLKLHLQLHELRPAPLTPQPVAIALNGNPITLFTPTNDLAAYDFDLPASDLRGDAVIDLRSDTFTPKDTLPNSTDERALGLFVDQVKLEYGSGLIVPPLIVYALLIASVLALYGLSKTIGLSARVSFVDRADPVDRRSHRRDRLPVVDRAQQPVDCRHNDRGVI